MALSVIVLNRWLIGLIGINGAALATLIVVLVYGIIKIIFIKSKLNIQPFSRNTIKVLVVIMTIYFVINFFRQKLLLFYIFHFDKYSQSYLRKSF